MVLYMGGRDRRERVREKKGKEEKKRERIVNIEYRTERKEKGGDFTPPSINGGEEEKRRHEKSRRGEGKERGEEY